MVCPNCGRQLPNDAAFCSYCGTHTMEVEHKVDPPKGDNYIKCPKCGSRSQYVNKTKIESRNYSCSAGACGGILLGPIGLLLGLCGAKTTATDESKWICTACGYEFVYKNWEESLAWLNRQAISDTILIVVGALLIAFSVACPVFNGGIALFISTGAILLISGFLPIDRRAELQTGHSIETLLGGSRAVQNWKTRRLKINIISSAIILGVGVLFRMILWGMYVFY